LARCNRCSAIFSSQDEEEIIPNRLLVNSAASLLWICAVVVAMDVISQFSSFRQILATDASGNQRQATATVHVQHSRQYCLGVGEQRVGIKWKAKSYLHAFIRISTRLVDRLSTRVAPGYNKQTMQPRPTKQLRR